MIDFILFPVTYKCNLKCSYCKLCNAEIDYQKSLSTIKNMKESWVYITGGEPLLLDNIFEICKEIKSYGKKVGITTNGTTDKIDIIKYVNRLGVSIDGNQAYHEKYRGIGTYNKAVSFLKECVGKVETVIMTTLTDRIMQEKYITELGSLLNVDYVQFTEVM